MVVRGAFNDKSRRHQCEILAQPGLKDLVLRRADRAQEWWVPVLRVPWRAFFTDLFIAAVEERQHT